MPGPKKIASGAVPGDIVLPEPIRVEIAACLDAMFEDLSDDGGAIMEDGRPRARDRDAARFAKRAVDALAELMPAWAKAIRRTTPALADFLARSSLDRADEAVDVVAAAAHLRFDATPRVVSADLRDALEATLTTAIDVSGDACDTEDLADRIVVAAREALDAHVATSDEGWTWLRGYLAAVLFDGALPTIEGETAREVAQKFVPFVVAAQNLKFRPVRSDHVIPYDSSRAYHLGDVLLHAKLGEGEVVELLDGKVAVVFGGTRRLLVCART